MSTTPQLSLRYSPDSDLADAAPTQLQNLANDIDAFYGVMSTWTPTVKQSGTLTMTTNQAEYRQFGHTVEFEFKLTYSSGTATAGQAFTVSPPVNSATPGLLPVGHGFFFDSSAATYYHGIWSVNGAVTNALVLYVVGGQAGAQTFTAAVAAGDIMFGTCAMEV